MTYYCRGRLLNLFEESGVDIPLRRFLWVAYNATCDCCWHEGHGEPVPGCLRCFPPQELAA